MLLSNIVNPSSTLFLLLSTLVLSSLAQPPLQNTSQTISIQTTKETFMSYIPLTSDCNYPETLTVLPGKLEYTELDPATIFESIEVVNEVFFWGAVLDGMRMIVNQQELLQNGQYDQVVLFNSSISSNFTQREVILVQVDTIGNIIFTYAEPMYNYSSNTLTPSPISQTTFQLGDQISKIVRDCSNSGNTIKITYAGRNIFLGLCPNTTNLFAWDASNTTRRNVYSNVSFMNGDNIQNMTGNPYLLVPGATVNINETQQLAQFQWNVVFLGQLNTDAYFCQVNLTSITCQNHENSQLWTQIVVERAWGLEATAQLSQIQFILSQFPQITSFTFPGSITSIFSYSSTIFIQSTDLNTTYLSIFQSGNQLANVTLKGGVVYYGKENLVVEEDGTFWIVDFILPIHIISNDLFPRDNVTYYIDCQDVEYELNYDIFWSDIAYPSYFIQQTDTQPQVSYQNVKIDNLDNYYTVIGPAFQIFIGTNDNTAVNITLLDISQMLGIEGFINIVSIVLVSSSPTAIPKYLFFLDLKGILKRYKISSKQILTMPAPCGYSNFVVSQVMQNGILFISNSGICLCTNNLVTCSPISQSQLPRTILDNTVSKADYALTMKRILKAQGLSSSSSSPTPSPTNNAIKKQLLAVVNQDLIINIYQNNTVTLTNFQGKVIDTIPPNSTNCFDYNSTDGTIFSRNFYDDYLILFCYSSPTITQYLIRDQKFLYNREVPIYGFITVDDSTAVYAGTNYVFLQVNLDPLFFGQAKVKANDTHCCILRLDPDQFTVGVIAEIIVANKLLAVQSMFGVDIVFYNQTQVSTSMPFIKIYFDSSWISYQQFTVCTPSSGCAPTTYPYMLTFISNFYNFAAMYLQTITFNVTASAITVTDVPSIQDVQMTKYITNYTFYNSSSLYNFNNFCGPIQSFHQANQNLSFGSIFSITINTILVKNKEITSNYSDIFQIVDMEDMAPATSFAGLVMVVGLGNLTFYAKFDGIWMDTVQVLTSTQESCVYFLSEIIDNYTIVLGSDCYNLQVQTPLITLTYNPKYDDPFNASFSTMQLPLQLRSITTVLNGNTTQILGIQQGPSKSVSGVLYLCQNVCNCLSTETKEVFFVDYDQQQTSQGLLIVGLDVYKLFFWINPTLTQNSSATINADNIIDYQQQLGFACSKVKIVYGSLTQPNIILSCPNGYIQVVVDFATGLIITQNQLSFAKFANCQQIDRFKPQIILAPGSLTQIIFLAVQCQQNIDTVRLQEIYALNSNTSVTIITGYLQLYTYTGPQCNGKWYPLRIQDLGTSSQYMSYLIYNANSQYKILYESINGILIDAFIDMVPRSDYELIQLTKDVNYPEVLMTIRNPYYQLGLIIQTNPDKLDLPGLYFDLALSFFVVFNVVTVVFFICWCFLSRNNRRTFHTKYFNDQFVDKSSIFTSRDSKASYRLNILDKYSIASGNSHAPSEDRPSVDNSSYQSSNPGDVSMYQDLSRLPAKKRGTEIQLFQPR